MYNFLSPRNYQSGDFTFLITSNIDQYLPLTDQNTISAYTSQAYRDMSAQINGFSRYLIVLEKNTFLGLIPLHRVNLLRYSSGYSGFALSKSSSITEAETFFRALNVYFKKHVLLSFLVMQGFAFHSTPDHGLMRQIIAAVSVQGMNYVPTRFLMLEKNSSEEKVIMNLNVKIRNQIRKADTSAFCFKQVKFSEIQSSERLPFIEQYVSLINFCRSETGMPPILLKNIFLEINALEKSGIEVFFNIAYRDHQIVAACAFHQFKDTALYAQGGALNIVKKTNVYSVLIFKSIVNLNKVCSYIEMGRVDRTTQKLKNLDHFKMQFSNRIFFGIRFEYIPFLYRFLYKFKTFFR